MKTVLRSLLALAMALFLVWAGLWLGAEWEFRRGRASYERGDLTEAIADLDRAIGMRPRFAVALYYRGLARIATRNDYDAALADIDAALAIRSWFPGALRRRGDLRARRGDDRGALADYDASIL